MDMDYLCRHWARCTGLGNHSPSGLAPSSGHRGLNRTKHHNKILSSFFLPLSLLSLLSVVILPLLELASLSLP